MEHAYTCSYIVITVEPLNGHCTKDTIIKHPYKL